VCHLNLCVQKWGSRSSFRRKRPFISLNSSAFIENLSSSEGARARARANHAENNAQEGCVMQLNGITLIWKRYFHFCFVVFTSFLKLLWKSIDRRRDKTDKSCKSSNFRTKECFTTQMNPFSGKNCKGEQKVAKKCGWFYHILDVSCEFLHSLGKMSNHQLYEKWKSPKCHLRLGGLWHNPSTPL